MKNIQQKNRKNRYRNKRISIYVTEAEREKIEKNIKKVGVSTINEFGRLLMLYGCIYNFNMEHLSDLAYEVNKVGINVNQIAKKLNQTGNIYKNEIDEIIEKLDKLTDFVDTLYAKQREINLKFKR